MLPLTLTVTVVLPGSTGWAWSAMAAMGAAAMRYIRPGAGPPPAL